MSVACRIAISIWILAFGSVESLAAQEFRRGDVDADGAVTLADAATLRNSLLLGATPINCGDAADVNDDGSVTILDVVDLFASIYGLNTLLLDAACGPDVTPDGLDCAVYGACPTATALVADPQHTIWIPEARGSVGVPVDVPVYYDNVSGQDLVGVNFGVTHDEAVATLTDVQFGTAILGLQGNPPFYLHDIVPGGWVCGAIFETYGAVDTLAPGTALELYLATYELQSAASTALEVTGALGAHPVGVRVYLFGSTKLPLIQHGSLAPATFLRGDANADGGYNISDAVFQLNALFGNSAEVSCVDAADTNDDGSFNLADPIFALADLFTNGPRPPAPGLAQCGIDPTVDALDCASFSPCF